MKLINRKLNDNTWDDVDDKVLKHAPYYSPVREHIKKNFGCVWNDDSLITLKILNPRWHIRRDLDETD